MTKSLETLRWSHLVPGNSNGCFFDTLSAVSVVSRRPSTRLWMRLSVTSPGSRAAQLSMRIVMSRLEPFSPSQGRSPFTILLKLDLLADLPRPQKRKRSLKQRLKPAWLRH